MVSDCGKPTQKFSLAPNYPNPFNGGTRISYYLPERGWVSAKIFNAAGEVVRVLQNEMETSGKHVLIWNGHNDGGSGAPSGVYWCRVRWKNRVETQKLLLLR